MKSKTLWILLALVVIAAALVLLLFTTGLTGSSESMETSATQPEKADNAPEQTAAPSPKPTPTPTPEPTVDPELPVLGEESAEEVEPGSIPAVTPYPASETEKPDENETPRLP